MEYSCNVDRLNIDNKEIILVGTAHVSKESSKLVSAVIENEKPDTVCVELCDSRYNAIRNKDRWLDTDIVKVIKEKKAFLLLSNLLLASFQKRIAEKFDVRPGEEMIQAIESAEAAGASVQTVDRDIRITLSRVWRIMSFWDKVKLLSHLLMSVFNLEEIKEEDVEKMKQDDMLEMVLTDIGKSFPAIRSTLIDERDQYLSQKIKKASGNKIVAVVGAGHVPGIKKYIHENPDLSKLEIIPPKSRSSEWINWMLCVGVILPFVLGFFWGGSAKGTGMVVSWILITGAMAGIGALLALAHPLTILSSFLAAPLTTIHPLIVVGWVSGLVEAFSRKPKVRDFEMLSQDILSIKGFWKNNVSRILLVVVFTNIGGTIGTLVAVPMLLKSLG